MTIIEQASAAIVAELESMEDLDNVESDAVSGAGYLAVEGDQQLAVVAPPAEVEELIAQLALGGTFGIPIEAAPVIDDETRSFPFRQPGGKLPSIPPRIRPIDFAGQRCSERLKKNYFWGRGGGGHSVSWG